MISEVKQAIVNKLLEHFPASNGYTIYDEDVPQNFKKKSFLISLFEQDYTKRLSNKYKSLLSFDLAYFSSKGPNEIKADCHSMQLSLFRALDLIGTYRVLNKQVNITDNVLHITFDVSVSEIKEEAGTKMQQQQTNTNL